MIHAIAFDLDDTLIDTSGLLVPEAARQACGAMIARGYQGGMETCLRLRAEMATQFSHRELFHRIAGPTLKEAADAAVHHFYHPTLPHALPLLPDAREVLEQLRSKYRLYLVTSGAPEVQRKKIQAAGLESDFEFCFTVNGFDGETKSDAFQSILRREGVPAQRLLAVGNRLSQEIRQAKLLGGLTCYFRHGEHSVETPQTPEERPDFIIDRWSEFIQACRL